MCGLGHSEVGAGERPSWRAVAILLTLAALLTAAHSARAQQLTLKYRFAEGDTASYTFSCSTRAKLDVQKGLTTSAAEMSLQMKVSTEVTEVAPNGDAKLRGDILSGSLKVKAEGEEETTPVGEIVTNYVLTPRGVMKAKELLSGEPIVLPGVSVLMEADDAFLLGGLGLLPERPVKPGEKWKGVARLPALMDEEVLTVTYDSKLLGIEQYKGRPCAKIRTTVSRRFAESFEAPDGSGPAKVSGLITGDGTWRFDYERGVIMSMEQRAQVVTEMSHAESTAKVSSVLNMRAALTELNGQKIPAK